MRLKLTGICLLFLFVFIGKTNASHIVGADMSYKCLGTAGNASRYEITLDLYHDCINGNPQAISQDNPAIFAIYEGNGRIYLLDSVTKTGMAINVPANFSNDCINNPPNTCLQKTTFTKTFLLPHNTSGYYVVYQRCCRNEEITNIRNSGETGATYFCTIPPGNLTVCNNSAVFKNFPPQIICENNPLIYDHSATDIDGDSLSYEFCETNIGGSIDDVKPMHPSAPPFGLVSYTPPYSSLDPMRGNPPVQIDPVTGIMSGTPNIEGRFVVSVCCHEWRNGVIINTVKREFQFVVTNCSKAVVADIPQYSDEPNTYIVECKNFTVKFDNHSTGGFNYFWDFGVPSMQDDTSVAFDPVFTYPDTGTYIVKLVVNKGSTCPDSIERFVKIYPRFTGYYNFNGKLCPGVPVQFKDSSIGSMYGPIRWDWNFGDGFYATEREPPHTFLIGGNYYVELISRNSKGCTDTVRKKIEVEKFVPFAGNDTIIVKNASIQFNARGGGDYTWTPGYFLNSTTIGNPTALYPDVGYYAYNVHVTSPIQQCEGDDSIRIRVVEKASIYVPSAFTPNGDGLNDLLRPIGVGYAQINYFRVYNRWGEQVYYTTKFKEGWNGVWKGTPADTGVYFWVLSIINRFGEEEIQKGDATLLR